MQGISVERHLFCLFLIFFFNIFWRGNQKKLILYESFQVRDRAKSKCHHGDTLEWGQEWLK